MSYLLYLMYRYDRRCDEKFGNLVETKHTPIWFGFWQVGVLIKSANGALQQLRKWMAPDRASV